MPIKTVRVLFTPARFNSTAEGLLRQDKYTALHVEPLRGGLALAAKATTFFKFSTNTGTEPPCLLFELGVVHFGQVISKWDGSIDPFNPEIQQGHVDRPSLSVGDQEIWSGFSGKGVSRRGFGWLPKYLLIGIGGPPT